MEGPVLITNIQRWSVNDGPGIRTKAFIKGCPLDCLWCHNPECKKEGYDIYWKRLLCVQCGLCLAVCPNDAINPPIPIDEARDDESTYFKIIKDKCDLCMKCVEVCPYEALVKVGDELSVEDILKEAERDMPFYIRSGGGMTISGGEPTTRPEYVMELLKGAKERSINICLDTCGHCDWEILEEMAKYVDVFLYDLKHMDSSEHKRLTNVENEKSLGNLRKLAAIGAKFRLRMPIIPDYNDSIEHMEEVAKYVESLQTQPEAVDLLPFHNWCQEKYRNLGDEWELTDIQAMENIELEPLKEVLEAHNIVTTIGG
ncbi:MAG: glycyl-radical enzyme activating protein [Thermodesulfobacteriota bacterium]|nr:glycyl-radical enzyme activating protein [Thermodesulfobacteriota bacterium]